MELVRLGELPASDPAGHELPGRDRHHDRGRTPSGTGHPALQRRRLRRLRAVGLQRLPGHRPAVGHRQPGHRASRGRCCPARTARTRSWRGNPGQRVGADLAFMLNSASGVGLVPEQVWNYADVPASPYGADPATASIGFTNGQPDGSAAPLTWAQAQLLRLISDRAAGRLLEQPVDRRPAVHGRRPARDHAPRGDGPGGGQRRQRAREPDPPQRDRGRRVGDRLRHQRAGRVGSRRHFRNENRRAAPDHHRSRASRRARPGRSRCR